MARQTRPQDETRPNPRRPHKEVYGIVDRGEDSYWTRIGAAFVNEDGSLNLVLNYIPTDPRTTIQIRDPKPRES